MSWIKFLIWSSCDISAPAVDSCKNHMAASCDGKKYRNLLLTYIFNLATFKTKKGSPLINSVKNCYFCWILLKKRGSEISLFILLIELFIFIYSSKWKFLVYVCHQSVVAGPVWVHIISFYTLNARESSSCLEAALLLQCYKMSDRHFLVFLSLPLEK